MMLVDSEGPVLIAEVAAAMVPQLPKPKRRRWQGILSGKG